MADSLLKQLFYNFLDNSLKYGEKVTQIRLHFTKEGDGVKLFYEDNGVGIPEANKPKLFHEGFYHRKKHRFGLFLIKKMVEVYGWTITEEGEPGKGAKFVITIPTSVFERSACIGESECKLNTKRLIVLYFCLKILVGCNISRESACETNSILDCLGDLLFIIDKNRIITKVNKSTCDTIQKETRGTDRQTLL